MPEASYHDSRTGEQERALVERVRAQLADLRLSDTLAISALALAGGERLSIPALAEVTGLDVKTVRAVAARLEVRGIVEYFRSGNGRIRSWITLVAANPGSGNDDPRDSRIEESGSQELSAPHARDSQPEVDIPSPPPAPPTPAHEDCVALVRTCGARAQVADGEGDGGGAAALLASATVAALGREPSTRDLSLFAELLAEHGAGAAPLFCRAVREVTAELRSRGQEPPAGMGYFRRRFRALLARAAAADRLAEVAASAPPGPTPPAQGGLQPGYGNGLTVRRPRELQAERLVKAGRYFTPAEARQRAERAQQRPATGSGGE